MNGAVVPARAERVPAGLGGRWSAERRTRLPSAVGALVARRARPWSLPEPGVVPARRAADRDRRGRAGQRAAAGERHPRRPPAGDREPRRGHRRPRRRGGRRVGAAAGLRALAGELHRRRPVPRQRRQRRHPARPSPRSASRSWSAAIVDAGEDHVLNQGIVWDPETGAGERYTKHHPVRVRRVHPVPPLICGARASRTGAARPDRPRHDERHPRPAAPGGRDRGRRRDLLRRRLRRRVLRPGRERRRAAHRADQQRQLHLHRPDRPAVRDHPAARDRVRASTSWSPPPTASPASSRPTAAWSRRPTRARRRCCVEQVGLRPGLTPGVRLGEWLSVLLPLLTAAGARVGRGHVSSTAATRARAGARRARPDGAPKRRPPVTDPRSRSPRRRSGAS